MVQEPSHVKQLSLIHVCKIGLKVHNHEIFFFHFFEETESLWSQWVVTGTQAWNILFPFFWRNWMPMVPMGCNRTFLKILYVAKIFKILNISELAECSLKSFWMMLLVWAVISFYAGHAQKLVPRTSMCENFLLTGWVHIKIILAHHMHFYYSQPGRVWLVTSQLGTGKSLIFSCHPYPLSPSLVPD